MTRDELLRALDADAPAHRACRQALLDGAEVTIWDSAVPASRLERIYRRREALTRKAGQRTMGLAEAVSRLREYGTEPVRLGKVTIIDPPYVFMLFLVLGQPQVIACTGVQQPPR